MARRVAELMRKEFVFLGEADEAHEGERTLRMARLRHAPVLAEDGRLLGVLSHRDLLQGVLDRLERELGPQRIAALLGGAVGSLATGQVIAVDPDCTPRRAARLLLRCGIGFLPVVEGERVVGIVTESDLLRAAYGC